MIYNVNYTDSRKTPIQVDPDTQLNGLPVKLFGRAFLEYGEQLNETFLSILENFSIEQAEGLFPPEPNLTSFSSPRLENPVEGQTWHNKTDDAIYFYDGAIWVKLGSRNDIGANWGQVLNGEQIPRPVSPDGYVFPYEECIWSVSPASYLENFTNMVCYTDDQARVSIRYDRESTGERIASVANYLIVGIKGNSNPGTRPIPIEPSMTPTPTPVVTPTPSVGPVQGTVWLSTQSAEIGTYNRNTGLFTPFVGATSNIYTDLAYDGIDLYGTTFTPGTGSLLWRINPTNGNAVLAAPNIGTNLFTTPFSATAMCAGPGGDLFVMSSGRTELYRINKTNGNLTIVADIGVSNNGDIVYDQATQRFYIIGSNGTLRSFSLINNTVSTIGTLVDGGNAPISPVFGLVAQNNNLYGYCFDNGREYNISKNDARSALLRQIANPTTLQFYNFLGAAYIEEGAIPPIVSMTPSPTPTPTPTPTPSSVGCTVLVYDLDQQLTSGVTYRIGVRSRPNSQMTLQFSPSYTGSTINFTTDLNGDAFVFFTAPIVVGSSQFYNVQVVNNTVSNCSSFSGTVVVNAAGPSVSQTPTPTPSATVSPTPTPTPTPPPLNVSFFNSSLGEGSAFTGFSASCSFGPSGTSSGTGISCLSGSPNSCGTFSCAPVSNTPLGIRVTGGTPPYIVRMTSSGQTGASGLPSGNCFAIGGAGPISSSTPITQEFSIGTISASGGSITGLSLLGSCGSQNTTRTGSLNFIITDSAGQSTSRGTTWGFVRDGTLEGTLIPRGTLTREYYSGSNLSAFYSLGITLTGLTNELTPGQPGTRLIVRAAVESSVALVPPGPRPIQHWIDVGSILGDEPAEWASNYWVRFVPIGSPTGTVSGSPNTWSQIGTSGNGLFYEANVGIDVGTLSVHAVQMRVEVGYSTSGPPAFGTTVLEVNLTARTGAVP